MDRKCSTYCVLITSFTLIAEDLLSWGAWVPKMIVVGAMFSNAGSYLAYLHTSATGLAAMSEKGDAPAIFSWRIRYFGFFFDPPLTTDGLRYPLGFAVCLQRYDTPLGPI